MPGTATLPVRGWEKCRVSDRTTAPLHGCFRRETRERGLPISIRAGADVGAVAVCAVARRQRFGKRDSESCDRKRCGNRKDDDGSSSEPCWIDEGIDPGKVGNKLSSENRRGRKVTIMGGSRPRKSRHRRRAAEIGIRETGRNRTDGSSSDRGRIGERKPGALIQKWVESFTGNGSN